MSITADDILQAMEKMRTARRSGCPPHVVRPARLGYEWQPCEMDEATDIVRCSNLCGFAMWVREVPIERTSDVLEFSL